MMALRGNTRWLRLAALGAGLGLGLLAGPGGAGGQTPPLEVTLAFVAPPPYIFRPGTPIQVRLQLRNTSGASVYTTEGFAQAPRLVFLTDPTGATFAGTPAAVVPPAPVLGFCFSRGQVLQRPTALPVHRLETLSTAFATWRAFVVCSSVAAEMLALSDKALRRKLVDHRRRMAGEVAAKARKVSRTGRTAAK